MRTKIIRSALSMFFGNGIRNISMDDIACEAGISKRTLYEHFSSKHDLLKECITISFMKRSFFPSDSLLEPQVSSLDIIIRLYHYYLLTTLETNPTCIKDLQKYYPDLFNETFRYHDRMVGFMLRKIAQDQQKGLIREDVENQLVSFFYKDILYLLFVTDSSFNRIERGSLLPEVLINFTRGICTPQGIQYLETSLLKK